IRHDKNRPLLQTPDPEAKLREIMAQREPLYRETAHITINTGDVSIRAAIQAILDRLKNHQQQKRT
ncbi:MAG TPA: shikimate kinase, partial [Gammaproteobacteria bacterium]|nr:shikimate kinase [Gammaproteobacteria bacterium]